MSSTASIISAGISATSTIAAPLITTIISAAPEPADEPVDIAKICAGQPLCVLWLTMRPFDIGMLKGFLFVLLQLFLTILVPFAVLIFIMVYVINRATNGEFFNPPRLSNQITSTSTSECDPLPIYRPRANDEFNERTLLLPNERVEIIVCYNAIPRARTPIQIKTADSFGVPPPSYNKACGKKQPVMLESIKEEDEEDSMYDELEAGMYTISSDTLPARPLVQPKTSDLPTITLTPVKTYSPEGIAISNQHLVADRRLAAPFPTLARGRTVERRSFRLNQKVFCNKKATWKEAWWTAIQGLESDRTGRGF